MIKNSFKLIILLAIYFCCSYAQAKVGTMVWYPRPNAPINHTISAISPSLSATCVSNIRNGKIILNINDKQRELLPGSRVSFSLIKGQLGTNGRFNYHYTIVWNLSGSPQPGVYMVKCVGDNHLSY